ncbi:hypothetical protein GGI43DRAFT_419399 [Trichoderma evansii]
MSLPRLASSQNWISGSQLYNRECTIAMRQELKLHYVSQSWPLDDAGEELTEEEELKWYQDLCEEVGIPPSDSIAVSKNHLKDTLVNIIELIDAGWARKRVEL